MPDKLTDNEIIKTATFVCCPMCDEESCVGKFNCNEIKEYVEKLKEREGK